ncbi:MAG: hypothetical protein ABI251_01435 [Mycobacteriaceae bacterium]
MTVPQQQSTELSTSSLAYLFADYITPLMPAGKRGQTAFASGAVVNAPDLAVRLGMVAVWGLREAGIVRLEPYEAKKLMVKVHGVHAQLVSEPQRYDGIENKVLTQWYHGGFAPAGEDVGKAFTWIPLCPSPGDVVITTAMSDAVANGFLVRVPLQRSVGARLAGKPAHHLQPVPDRIDALRPRAAELRDRWVRFTQTEQYLFAALEKTIATNIHRRERSDDNDSDD